MKVVWIVPLFLACVLGPLVMRNKAYAPFLNAQEQLRGDGGATSLKGKNLPNLVFILIDDQGYADFGSRSEDLRALMPNLNWLEREGVRLENYYSMHTCTPARAALLTGKYPMHMGMQGVSLEIADPWGLPLEHRLLPQYLAPLGYSSHAIGKWHLGFFSQDYLPNHRGFDS
eukprot:CAMPEP_0113945942 /NCGR_PEP_ID=MMETSP1339-20121228/53210_1 /TAXON_ID=94617 /ORGANISM="Fibrocapsa japonica" /LENGTH=171 /DNA_ID=CAMNT_0000951793 /DNA_START=45 /DNA_END=557 /DNA_ORIENTATION=+ /assembly_acc=CAM_ASM_000762